VRSKVSERIKEKNKGKEEKDAVTDRGREKRIKIYASCYSTVI